MKKLLIFTAIFLIRMIGNTQTTELDTIFEHQGYQVTVLEVVKKAEVIGQFTLLDSVEFTQQEYKQLFLGEAVDKLMESHLVLIQLFPPQRAKVGTFVTFYHFRDGIQKGEIKTQIIDKPEFSLALLLAMVLSLIFITCGWLISYLGMKNAKGVLFGMATLIFFVAGLEFYGGGIWWNELYKPYRSIYWQLIGLFAGYYVLGFIVHEVFAWLRRIKKSRTMFALK